MVVLLKMVKCLFYWKFQFILNKKLILIKLKQLLVLENFECSCFDFLNIILYNRSFWILKPISLLKMSHFAANFYFYQSISLIVVFNGFFSFFKNNFLKFYSTKPFQIHCPVSIYACHFRNIFWYFNVCDCLKDVCTFVLGFSNFIFIYS